MSDLLTISRLKDARACARKHHLKFYEGLRPADDAAALRFGTLIHNALEAMWVAWQVHGSNPLGAALETIPADADLFDRAKATAMLTGYHERWKSEPYDVLAVERQFIVPLVNPLTGKSSRTWRLAGKVDVVVRDQRDGRVLLVEHKTSSEDISLGSEYWRRLRMDGQVSVYFEGARALGYDVAACIYDALFKPALRPLQVNSKRTVPESPDEYLRRCLESIAEDPARYYARGEVVRLEAEMRDAMWDVWQTGQQIREGELANRWPRNPDACSSFGRTCAYFPLCSGEASADDTSLFTKVDNVHPELSHQPKEEVTDGNHADAAE